MKSAKRGRKTLSAHKISKPIGSGKNKRTIFDNSKSIHHAVSLVKLVGITMKLKELNNHIQGLYAELGKLVVDQQIQRNARVDRMQKVKMEGLLDTIMEMRKKIEGLERDARTLKKVA